MHEVGDIRGAGDRKCSPPGRDVAELAARQHGVVALWQLRDLGQTRETVRSWVRREWLHPVHAGVYGVGHGRLRGDARLMAAVLACGRDAVLSHRSAAQVWGIRRSASARIEVTVPRSRRGRPGIVMHRTRSLDASERTWRDGFPVTTVARTLVDLAGCLRRDELERAVEESERLGLFDLPAVEASCVRGRGRRGVRRLCELIAHVDAPIFTRSELERRFRSLCRDNDLPLPSHNVCLHGYEVDAYWPEHGLIVELDGFEFHRTRKAFDRDRRRDAILAAAGLHVLRLGWREVADPALAVAALSQRLRPR